MSGTSKISQVITIRLPNEVVYTLQRKIDGRRSRWGSVGEYLRERIIYDVVRPHTQRGKKK